MRSHVTKAESQAVVAYAVDLCAALHLPGYLIFVMDDPCDDGSEAVVEQIDGRWAAQLYLSSDWMKFDDGRRRRAITHEMLHLLHFPVTDVVLEDTKLYMHDHEHADWSRRVRRQFEYMVDHLALWMSETHSLKEAWAKAHGRE